jgi:hypothetical protein
MRPHYILAAWAALILMFDSRGVAQQYSFRHYGGAADGLQNLSHPVAGAGRRRLYLGRFGRRTVPL